MQSITVLRVAIPNKVGKKRYDKYLQMNVLIGGSTCTRALSGSSRPKLQLAARECQVLGERSLQ